MNSSRAAAQSSWGVSVEERKRFARRKTIDFMEPAPLKKKEMVFVPGQAPAEEDGLQK